MFISFHILAIFVSLVTLLMPTLSSASSALYSLNSLRCLSSTFQKSHASKPRPGPAVLRYFTWAVGPTGQSRSRVMPNSSPWCLQCPFLRPAPENSRALTLLHHVPAAVACWGREGGRSFWALPQQAQGGTSLQAWQGLGGCTGPHAPCHDSCLVWEPRPNLTPSKRRRLLQALLPPATQRLGAVLQEHPNICLFSKNPSFKSLKITWKLIFHLLIKQATVLDPHGNPDMWTLHTHKEPDRFKDLQIYYCSHVSTFYHMDWATSLKSSQHVAHPFLSPRLRALMCHSEWGKGDSFSAVTSPTGPARSRSLLPSRPHAHHLWEYPCHQQQALHQKCSGQKQNLYSFWKTASTCRQGRLAFPLSGCRRIQHVYWPGYMFCGPEPSWFVIFQKNTHLA